MSIFGRVLGGVTGFLTGGPVGAAVGALNGGGGGSSGNVEDVAAWSKARQDAAATKELLDNAETAEKSAAIHQSTNAGRLVQQAAGG